MPRNELILCPSCQLTLRLPHGSGSASELHCPRCTEQLTRRKPHSATRTWALLLASALLYIPANVLPMTRTTFLGGVQNDTIFSGVVYFIEEGSWHVALIIFVASIVVPLAKIAVLGYLLVTVQRGSTRRNLDRTRLYRMTHLIGRWSMIDLFVVATVSALVKLGRFSQVEPGPAALFFAAVVVLTLLAAETFDPRLIWDPTEPSHAQ